MNYKILIVDDQPDNLDFIISILEDENQPYEIIQAVSGDVALDIARNELPNLIITDWQMPKMDGLQLIKEIKLIPQLIDVPVIMCTGAMTTPENLRMAFNAGAVDFIRKPIDPIELLARIKSMLELSDSRKKLFNRYIELERKNIFIESLIESIPHPFVYYDLEGEIAGCNRRFEKLLGLSNNQIEGSKINVFFDDKTINLQYVNKDLEKEGGDVFYESCYNDRDFIISQTLFYLSNNTPGGIMCVLSDVTELKKAHQEIIEAKKRELTSSALRLIQMSELNNSLLTDLDKINAFTNEKGSELIRQTVSKINMNSSVGFWSEFETRFENVYESFYQKLDELYPKLTLKERKLCALLRLDLTSKDIAAITFQNPQSVDMARYRLRKKLDLSSEENLIDFLMKIDE